MLLYRAVKQRIEPEEPLPTMMETFLLMMNDCLRLGLDSDDISYQAIKSLCYPRMMEYEVGNSYRLSAIFETSNLIKQYRNGVDKERRGRPYCKNPFFSASLGVRVEGEDLLMPDGIRLRLNPHTLVVLKQKGVEVVSATVIPGSLSIIYKREVPQVETGNAVALDVNLRNATSYDTEGRAETYDLAKLVQIQEQYRRTTSRFRRQDYRIKRRLFGKYATIAADRRSWILNNTSTLIVYRAAALKQTIVMENMRGVTAMFAKQSKSSAYYLAMMHAWPFAELQRQIGYKAQQEGIPVVYVDPTGTSNECSVCGGGMIENPAKHPLLTCRVCGLVIDRDLNAAKNILSRSLRSGAVGSADGSDGGPRIS